MIIDLLAIVLLILSVLKGYSKGLVVALFSSVAIYIGLLGALKLSSTVSAYLQAHGEHARWTPLLSFALVMLGIIILVRLGAKMISKGISFLQLGWANRIAGILLYLLMYFTFYSIVLYYASQVGLIPQSTIDKSQTYIWIQPWGPTSVKVIGKIVPWVSDIFSTLSKGFSKAAG